MQHWPKDLACAPASVAVDARPRLPRLLATSGQVNKVRGVLHCDIMETSAVMTIFKIARIVRGSSISTCGAWDHVDFAVALDISKCQNRNIGVT